VGLPSSKFEALSSGAGPMPHRCSGRSAIAYSGLSATCLTTKGPCFRCDSILSCSPFRGLSNGAKTYGHRCPCWSILSERGPKKRLYSPLLGALQWLEGFLESMEKWRLASVQVSLSSSASGPPPENRPFGEVLSSF
jgi:hypothetical protein